MKAIKKYLITVFDYSIQCGCSNKYCKHREKLLVINKTQLKKLQDFYKEK
jgi:hypothetical protein